MYRFVEPQGLFAQLQARFPTSSLTTELVQIQDGNFVVKAVVQVGGTVLASAMAAASSVEVAEDRAQQRVLNFLGIVPTGELDPLPQPQPLHNGNPAIAPLEPPLFSSPARPTIAPIAAPTVAPIAAPTIAPIAATLIEDLAKNYPDTNAAIANYAPEPYSSQPYPADSYPSDAYSGDSYPGDPDVDEFQAGELDRPIPSDKQIPAPTRDFLPEAPSYEVSSEDNEPPIDFSTVPAEKLKRSPTKPSKSEGAVNPAIAAPLPANPAPDPDAPIDLSSLIALTDVEMDRIGWTKQKGRDYLKQTYSKATRQKLDVEELMDFLNYLRALPSQNGLL